MRLFSSFNAKSNEKQLDLLSNNRYSIRTTCAICKAEFQHDELITSCIEYNHVNENCEKYKNYVGGELACDDSGAYCCCKVNYILMFTFLIKFKVPFNVYKSLQLNIKPLPNIQGSNCDQEFVNKFVGRKLKASTIDQPYSYTHFNNPIISNTILLLILFAL